MSNKNRSELAKYEEFVSRVLSESFGQTLDRDVLQVVAKKVAKVVEDSSRKRPRTDTQPTICRI